MVAIRHFNNKSGINLLFLLWIFQFINKEHHVIRIEIVKDAVDNVDVNVAGHERYLGQILLVSVIDCC